MCPSCNFENSQHLSNSPNFEQRTSLEVAHNSTLAEVRLQVLQESHSYLHKLGCQYGVGGDGLSGAKWVKYCLFVFCLLFLGSISSCNEGNQMTNPDIILGPLI